MNYNMTIGTDQRSFLQRILLISIIIVLFLVGFCLGTAITCVAYSKLTFLNDADEYSETISNIFKAHP